MLIVGRVNGAAESMGVGGRASSKTLRSAAPSRFAIVVSGELTSCFNA